MYLTASKKSCISYDCMFCCRTSDKYDLIFRKTCSYGLIGGGLTDSGAWFGGLKDSGAWFGGGLLRLIIGAIYSYDSILLLDLDDCLFERVSTYFYFYISIRLSFMLERLNIKSVFRFLKSP